MVYKRTVHGRVYRGNDCEFMYLCNIITNDGCADGTKFVIKQETGVRKQFLLLGGTSLLVFVNFGKKFPACESFTEVTLSVDCKTVDGLIDVDLNTAPAPSPAPAPTPAPTPAPGTAGSRS